LLTTLRGLLPAGLRLYKLFFLFSPFFLTLARSVQLLLSIPRTYKYPSPSLAEQQATEAPLSPFFSRVLSDFYRSILIHRAALRLSDSLVVRSYFNPCADLSKNLAASLSPTTHLRSGRATNNRGPLLRLLHARSRIDVLGSNRYHAFHYPELSRGLSVYVNQDELGTTPLHVASERGDVDLARLLIEHGADAVAPMPRI